MKKSISHFFNGSVIVCQEKNADVDSRLTNGSKDAIGSDAKRNGQDTAYILNLLDRNWRASRNWLEVALK